MSHAFALFETPLGICALVWRGRSIVGSLLPERGRETIRASVLERFPGAGEAAPPPAIVAVIGRVVRLLQTGQEPLDDIPVELAGVTAFQREVYEAARRIPPGETRSYGELARLVGRPGGARAVGTALGNNPLPLLVPCHRVLAAGGKLGGFTARGGLQLKEQLLSLERAPRAERCRAAAAEAG
jgi:methylated-DNA-[protein]-cysteine S-methyltransferase